MRLVGLNAGNSRTDHPNSKRRMRPEGESIHLLPVPKSHTISGGTGQEREKKGFISTSRAQASYKSAFWKRMGVPSLTSARR